MRKFIIALAVLLTIIFFITRFTEVQEIALTLERGDWRFLLLAAVVEAAWLANVGASYRSIYHILGLEDRRRRLLRVAAAANFFSVVAPVGGMSGLAVLIADARRQGYSSARATVAGALYVLFDYLGFLLVLAVGFFVLFQRNNLKWPEIIASLILIAIAGVITALLYLGTRSENEMGSVLAWMVRLVNRVLHPFIRRQYLSEDRAHTFAKDASEGVRMLRHKPKALIAPVALALSNKALLISVLLLIFLSFNITFTAGTLIAGFSMAYLFLIVSPTPQGIGVVEGVLTLSLNSLSIPLEAAAVVTLAYRGITFWLPFFFGMLAFRNMTIRGEISEVELN
ncbi:MAG: flippase-like domain-containing protein [Chloroflexi bacterium]|nr:flippase-like domain-containing protein [Chloroflexota bacterium]